MNEVEIGYQDADYLEDDYFEGVNSQATGIQYFRDIKEIHGEYLTGNYMEDAYLAEGRCYFQGIQYNRGLVGRVGLQYSSLIYNTTQLRILCDFDSRGTEALLGDNWTANNQGAGDHLPANLNTDILEQTFRSAQTNVILSCDTGISQGVLWDTLYFGNHNLTTDAIIQVQGSNDSLFNTVLYSFNLKVCIDNIFYVRQSFPAGSEQARYHRFIIQDPNNPDGYIDIGAIIFGRANIFPITECFIEPIQKGKVHFADKVRTEGFTNVTNDRAIRRRLQLPFQDLDIRKEGYKIMQNLFDIQRTSLKCVVIPYPRLPQFASVFAKLTAIPSEDVSSPSDILSSFNVEWDESL